MKIPGMTRATADYKNLSQRFFVDIDADYQRQYYRIYQARLEKLRPILTDCAVKRWGRKHVIKKTQEVWEENKDGEAQDKCILIGTIVKSQRQRPSVVKELASQVSELPQPIRAMKLTSEDDQLILEDDMHQVQLCGQIDTGEMVTGVMVALLGSATRGDIFEVEDYLCPPIAPQPPRPQLQDDKYLLFVSGLEMSGSEAEDGKMLMATTALADWLCGISGDSNATVKNIVRVIVAGNSIHSDPEDKMFSEMVRKLTSKKYQPPSVECMKTLDLFLARITPCVTVDVMPGENDPTNYMLPQQPLHRCMFPKATALQPANLNLVSNPYEASVDGRIILGTSGQNFDDIYRFGTTGSAVEIMEKTIQWQHLCPTAPDSLPSFPFDNEDPFVMGQRADAQCPDIYFAGNQRPKLEIKSIDSGPDGQKTLLLAVPPFVDTGVCVLVNFKNMQARPVKFPVKLNE